MVSTVKPLKSVSISIIGCGDIGSRVAQLLHSEGHTVIGYSRSQSSLAALSPVGIGTEAFDLDSLSKNAAPALTCFAKQLVYYFAPPSTSAESDSRMLAWLNALDTHQLPRRILYISTTGVYGDQKGQRIDETTPTNPQTARAKRRLSAEQSLIHFAQLHSIEYVILRVPGIYGPNRLPRKRLIDQKPILYPSVSPLTNRIHEDDLAQCCVTAGLHSDSGEIYNVSDGDTMTMSDYFITVAEHLNLPIPPRISLYEAESILSPEMLSYLNESRVIDNSKLISVLGITLKYPSLKHFLKLYYN